MNWIKAITDQMTSTYKQKLNDGMTNVEAYDYVIANTAAGDKAKEIFAAQVNIRKARSL